jgi:PAS domain S-box-containing protein
MSFCGTKVKSTSSAVARQGWPIKHVQITSNVNFREGEFLNTRCFTVDITEQYRAEETSRERDRQAREILEAIPAAVYTTDAVGRVTFFNEAAVKFSGRRPQLGSDEWCVTWRLYEPDGTPLPHDQCPMAVALKEGRSIRGAEAVAERPDGSRVPFIPFPTPLRDGSGAIVGAVNMLVDVSARKQAENEQRALINELNHRVKNTLATVQSIARQTFRATPTPEQFISKFEGRLLALSKAHGLLTRRRWTGLEFNELLDAEFIPFTTTGSERIHLDGPEITLPPQVGLVLAMVIHELATNAAKYGALCSNEGHVYLRWRLIDSPGGRRLRLLWQEAHGPRVVTPLKRGFGSEIIERIITKDLGGEIRFDFAPAGLVCQAEFSLGQ